MNEEVEFQRYARNLQNDVIKEWEKIEQECQAFLRDKFVLLYSVWSNLHSLYLKILAQYVKCKDFWKIFVQNMSNFDQDIVSYLHPILIMIFLYLSSSEKHRSYSEFRISSFFEIFGDSR